MTLEELLPPGATGPGVVERFTGAGGQSLCYRVVAASEPSHHLLYLHGIESHGTWFLPAADRLKERGCTTYLLDRRGSGLNRDPEPGDVPSAEVLLEDVHRFRRHLGQPALHLLGLSWGGKLALACALEEPQGLESLQLVTPGLKAKVDLTGLQKTLVLLTLLTRGKRRFPLPLEPEMFTATPRFKEFIARDPWRLHAASARLLAASRSLDGKIQRNLGSLSLPVLLLLAGRDRIIDNDRVLEMLRPLPRLKVIRFEDASHSLQFDEVDALVDEMAAFLQEIAR